MAISPNSLWASHICIWNHKKNWSWHCRLTQSVRFFLSLGRVGPAPHTQHLLGPFAAIAQNSSLWSFSIVDSLANRQHSCRGSEELAIRKTARFQATPSYFAELRATPSYSELLRATPSGGRPRTPSYSEQLRAAFSHSNREYQAPWKSQEAWYSQFLNSELLRATPSGY